MTMLEIRKRNNNDEFEPYLVLDTESGEMWGYDPMWSNSGELLIMDPEEVKERFAGSVNWTAAEVDEDPFDDIPMSVDVVRNYPVGSEDHPDVPPTDDEKAAEKAAERFVESLGGDVGGNLKNAADGDSAALSKSEYEATDDALREMHKNLVEWDGEDLSKAPPAWNSDDDIPEFVSEMIRSVIDQGVVWSQFEGYSRQAAKAIRNSLEENLTQPQGWSVASIVDDITEMYSGMSDEKALNIVRTELSAILNTAREEAYERRDDDGSYRYYWQGPSDHRTTKVCEEVKQVIEDRGGNVRLDELKSILMQKARKYEDTREGGTPERVDEWTPHYKCRHTFIRDVKASL